MKPRAVKTEIDQEAHRGLKALAGLRGVSLRQLLRELLEKEGKAAAERLAGKQ